MWRRAVKVLANRKSCVNQGSLCRSALRSRSRRHVAHGLSVTVDAPGPAAMSPGPVPLKLFVSRLPPSHRSPPVRPAPAVKRTRSRSTSPEVDVNDLNASTATLGRGRGRVDATLSPRARNPNASGDGRAATANDDGERRRGPWRQRKSRPRLEGTVSASAVASTSTLDEPGVRSRITRGAARYSNSN